VEIDLAKQRERAAKAETDLLELQQRVKDRHLTSEQMESFIAHLASGPKGSITVGCVGADPEPRWFSHDLISALQKAGWTVTDDTKNADFTIMGRGLAIVVKDPAHAPIRAVTLQKALESIGIPSGGFAKASLPDDDVKLVIATK